MTREQQIQYAIKAALEAEIEAAFAEADFSVKVHAVKIDNAPDDYDDKEEYPTVIINTSTPVPAGHKSRIVEVPCWVRIMTYGPDDRKREQFAYIAEVVFKVLHETEDWAVFEDVDKTLEINAVAISSSEEPTADGLLITQTTNCAVNANLLETITS